ncbi:MAG: hypothetical protein M1827_007427 [Pycnora praestabilis]|nr:MAG: hypothetical protein M1827_007427 [Pycnora praestabilis]
MLNPLHPLTQPSLHPASPSAPTAAPSLEDLDEVSPPPSPKTTSAARPNHKYHERQQSPPLENQIPMIASHESSAAENDMLGPDGKGRCYVFEVVLQRKEQDDCPACRRSVRRRKLPARNRGIYGVN